MFPLTINFVKWQTCTYFNTYFISLNSTPFRFSVQTQWGPSFITICAWCQQFRGTTNQLTEMGQRPSRKQIKEQPSCKFTKISNLQPRDMKLQLEHEVCNSGGLRINFGHRASFKVGSNPVHTSVHLKIQLPASFQATGYA